MCFVVSIHRKLRCEAECKGKLIKLISTKDSTNRIRVPSLYQSDIPGHRHSNIDNQQPTIHWQ